MSNVSTSADMSEENCIAAIHVESVCCYVTPSFMRISANALGRKRRERESELVAVQFVSFSMEP